MQRSSDSSDIRAILNLLGPTTTGSDVIEMDPVRLKILNNAAMAQKKRRWTRPSLLQPSEEHQDRPILLPLPQHRAELNQPWWERHQAPPQQRHLGLDNGNSVPVPAVASETACLGVSGHGGYTNSPYFREKRNINRYTHYGI